MGTYDAAAALNSLVHRPVFPIALSLMFTVMGVSWALLNLWMLRRLPAYSPQASPA